MNTLENAPHTLLVVTDLTRMQHGRVCIAGYTTDKQCVRLTLPPPQGVKEYSIVVDGKAIVFPFAVIECDLLGHVPDPPHTEDYHFDPATLRFVRLAPEPEKRKKILEWSLYSSISDLFGQTVHHDQGHYVMRGMGERSLGTIQPQAILRVEYKEGDEGSWSYRLRFLHEECWYSLKITDLTFNYYCDHLRAQGCEPHQIAEQMTALLKSRGVDVFLRIGLARGWDLHPDRCYLQLNGIHTLPDYTGGKTFVDFAQPGRLVGT